MIKKAVKTLQNDPQLERQLELALALMGRIDGALRYNSTFRYLLQNLQFCDLYSMVKRHIDPLSIVDLQAAIYTHSPNKQQQKIQSLNQLQSQFIALSNKEGLSVKLLKSLSMQCNNIFLGNAVTVDREEERKQLECEQKNYTAEATQRLQEIVSIINGNHNPLIKVAVVHALLLLYNPLLHCGAVVAKILTSWLLRYELETQQNYFFISHYFTVHRELGLQAIQKLRASNDWLEWLQFYVEALLGSGRKILHSIDEFKILRKKNRKKVKQAVEGIRSALKVHEAMLDYPVCSSKHLAKVTELTPATVNTSLRLLLELGIMEEKTRFKRNKIFYYREYGELLSPFC